MAQGVLIDLVITFGSNGLVYVTDGENKRVCVWFKEGTFWRDFMTKYAPYYVHCYCHDDNHLMIISSDPHTVTVYTLGGQQVHEFGGTGSDNLGRFNGLFGVCVETVDLCM